MSGLLFAPRFSQGGKGIQSLLSVLLATPAEAGCKEEAAEGRLLEFGNLLPLCWHTHRLGAVNMAEVHGNKVKDIRPVLNWVLVAALALAAASVLAPLVIRVIDAVPLFEGLRRYSGTKVFRRLVVVFLLLGVWIWRRRLLFPRAERIGLARHNAWRRHIAVGLLVGLVSLFLVQAAAFALGYRVPDRDHEFSIALLGQTIVKGLGTAVAVGILEEVLFRGALFHCLLRRSGRAMSVGLTSVLFAVVHFFRSGSTEVDRNSLLVGPVAAWDLLCGWWEHMHLFPDCVGLMLVSVVLCWSVVLAGDIYFAIGLHAGWVFVIQCARRLLDRTHGVSHLVFGGSQFYDGLVGLILLIAMIPFLHFCIRLGWIKPVGFRSGE